jgi:hypothetical protein
MIANVYALHMIGHVPRWSRWWRGELENMDHADFVKEASPMLIIFENGPMPNSMGMEDAQHHMTSHADNLGMPIG